MATIITAGGDPMPPAEVVRSLERVGQSVGTEFRMDWRRHMRAFAVMAKWKPSDRRWALIREGAIADYPYDTVAHFPEAANADEAFHLFVRGLKRSNRDDIAKAIDHLTHWNADVVPEQNIQKAVEPVLDDVTSIAGRRLTNTAASFGGIGEGPRRRRKAK